MPLMHEFNILTLGKAYHKKLSLSIGSKKSNDSIALADATPRLK